MAHKILLVEDDPCFGSVLKSYLELSDYEVTLCTNGSQGLEAFKQNKYDICLLDVMMPEMDGIALGHKIRELAPNSPFIYIPAKNQKEDMKLGYEAGADDYICKPFDSELLILKIKAILSRCENEPEEVKARIILIGDYTFNTELRTISINGQETKLTPKESQLLEMLYNDRAGLLTREKALTKIWGSNDYFTARSMDVYITKLRKYFKDNENIRIENVHGSGFRLIIENDNAL